MTATRSTVAGMIAGMGQGATLTRPGGGRAAVRAMLAEGSVVPGDLRELAAQLGAAPRVQRFDPSDTSEEVGAEVGRT